MDTVEVEISRPYRSQKTTALARRFAIIVLVGVIVAAPVVGSVGVASAQEASSSTINISDATVKEDASTSVDVTMSEAPSGLAGYDIVLGVENNSTATITDAEIAEKFTLSEVNVSDNGTSMMVNLRAVDLEENVQEGATNISLADIDIEGKTAGETNLAVQEIRRVDDDNGTAINVSSNSGQITVEEADDGGGNTTANLDIVPQRNHVTAGDEIKANVVLSEAPRGVAGFNTTVSVNGEEITIAAASAGDEFDLAVTDSDSDTAMIRGVDLNRNVQAGAENVTLATVHLRSGASADGTTEINITNVEVLENDEAETITVATSGATVEVHDVAPVVYDRLPTDADGDGLYEDIDGDGQVTNTDVTVFFEQFNSDAIQGHDEYDFDGNGRVTYNDIVVLSDLAAASG